MLRNSSTWLLIGFASLFVSFDGRSIARADRGKPVAVRWWGHSTVSIETYWNLCIVIDPYVEQPGHAFPRLNGDLVLILQDGNDHDATRLIDGRPVVVQARDAAGNIQKLRHVLDRLPNQDAPTWKDAGLVSTRSPHAVTVTSISFPQNEADEERLEAGVALLIEIDGVRIVHGGGLGRRTLANDHLAEIGRVDVLLVPIGGKEHVDRREASRIVDQIKPQIVVPISQTDSTRIDEGPTAQLVDALAPAYQVANSVGNTLAVTAAERIAENGRKIVVLKPDPWEMPDELATLFSRKEAACRASQAVFAPLSAQQMNFRPANGTHTPRWNAEHMMGRELGFFSQIFARIDPSMSHVDLNPQQMPPDFIAAHPDWSGEEEARQMECVTAYTRRFAYLLDGVDLDERAPGSRWTLRALLAQMERHYREHTGNVKKKFALPDWPH